MGEDNRETTILVVEDEEPIRLLMETILQREGYTVLCATDGEEAAKRIDSEYPQIDLLVTDLSLPGLSGDAVAEKVRKAWPESKVLFASGSFGQVPKENLHRIANATFLVKPFRPKELVAAVAALLR
jgi:DNA-binding response OmpR family regulator